MNTVIQVRPEESFKQSHDKVVDIVFKEDDLNWKDLIYNLVSEEQMDPWNIDVSLLSQRFIKMLETLKEMDFRVSGKMILTSSLLLKLKSDNLMNDGLSALDNLINGEQEIFEDLDDSSFEYEQYDLQQFLNDEKKLIPKTPQPRERKVSVFDLVNALEQALATDLRRQRVLSSQKIKPQKNILSTPSFDLAIAMTSIQSRIRSFFSTKKKTTLFFSDLLPEHHQKHDSVYTFLPLLHLENQNKLLMEQEDHFGPIKLTLYDFD
jgi:segregation and condensation protein A